MNKTIKYAKYGALLFGAINGIIEVKDQIDTKETEEKFDWERVLTSILKGALLGGLTGLAVGALRDYDMSKMLKKFGGAAGFVNDTLNFYSDDHILLSKKASQIQVKMNKVFGYALSSYPTLHGSINKGTSIVGSDIDIHLKFKKDFGSLETIRSGVEDFFLEEYKDSQLTNVRIQNCSIGLFFNIKGMSKRIDIVPMREVENGRGDTYLCINSNSFFKKNTHKKTNPLKQTLGLRFTEKQKNIIKLLKVWKQENNIHIASIYIEHLAKMSFEENRMPRGLKNSVLKVIEFIANNITTVRIVDLANSNNIISDSLSIQEKEDVRIACLNMLTEIKKDERNILDYFGHVEI